jgi:hypothetical protein
MPGRFARHTFATFALPRAVAQKIALDGRFDTVASALLGAV